MLTLLKLYLDNGVTGYGEALPRSYVSGETCLLIGEHLKTLLTDTLLGLSFGSFDEGISFFTQWEELQGAGRCCVETALFDALGKAYSTSISSLIGTPQRTEVRYSGIISAGSLASTIKISLKCKIYGFTHIKVKVGGDDDQRRLQYIRSIVGPKTNIRVDANCAWSVEEAIAKIEAMRPFGISTIEQPIHAQDFDGLQKITQSVPETIAVDESLVTIDNARELAHRKACDMFNIRLSKCGGILNALQMVDIARAHDITYTLGCHPGESGLLSAVGRHFACCVPDIQYCEGSYGTFLLKEDLTKERVQFGWGGKAPAIVGPGIGVSVRDEVLDKYSVKRFALSL